MKNLFHILTSTAAVALVCAGAWPMRAAGDAYIWNGAGADNRWDTLANWVGATNYPDALTNTASIQTNATPVNIDLNGNRSLQSLTINPYGEATFQITNSSLTLAAGGFITLNVTGTRGPNNQNWSVASPVNLLGDASISSFAGRYYGRALIVSGQIAGSNTLYFGGTAGGSPGYWGTIVSGNNTNFTGTVVITNTVVGMSHANAFGTNANPILLQGGNLAFNVGSGTKPVTVTNNSTFTAWGSSTYSGNVLLTNGPTLTLDSYNAGNTRSLTLNGVISGTGNLNTYVGAGLALGGTNANTFAGSVTVTLGTLVLNKTPGQDAIPGNVTIGNATAATHVLQLNNSNQVNDASVVSFGCTATNPAFACFRLNGFSETVAGLQSVSNNFGTVENSSASKASTLTLNMSSNYTFSGVMRDAAAGALNLVVGGSGSQTLSGANTYSGTTTISNGTLLVNGTNSGAGAFTVNSGATLGGTGTIGGAATFGPGANAVFTITTNSTPGSDNTTPLTIAGVMTYNANVVHLLLPTNLPAGTYTLATSSATAVTNGVFPTPVVDSGSFTAGLTATNITLDATQTKLLLITAGGSITPTPVLNRSGFTLPGGVPTFSFNTVGGFKYRMVCTDSLTNHLANWLPVIDQPNFPPADGWSATSGGSPMSLSDTNAAGHPQRFYRLEAGAP